MTTLVTGGAGYIGSITARALRASGRSVVVIDSLENGHAEKVRDAPLFVGNIADQDLVTRVCTENDVDEIVHFAAYKAVGESMTNPTKYFDNNVVGSQRLIDAATRAGVERFVFSSTASAYGTPDENPVDENAQLRPESVYAETKIMIERLLHWYGITMGLRSVSLRYFNAAGASDDATLGEDWKHSQNLLPHVMKAVLGHSPTLQVFGTDYSTPDGTGVRDYIHVEDLATAHVLALDYLASGGDTLICNIGTGKGTSVFDIIKATERVTGQKVPYVVTDRRPGDPAIYYADARLANERLGFTAVRSIDDMVRTAYEWHRNHLDGV